MTRDEFKKEQRSTGLPTNMRMAKILGVTVQTVDRYRSGRVEPPKPIQKILALCRKYQGAVRFLDGLDD